MPSGSTPVAAGIFLATDGRLIDGGSNGQVLATNVAATGQLFTGQVGWRIPLRKTDGTCVYSDGSSQTAATGVPGGSAPVAAGIFLAADGRLIDGGNNGNVLTSNVGSYGQLIAGQMVGSFLLPWRRSLPNIWKVARLPIPLACR